MGKRRRLKAFDKRKARMVDPGPDASGRYSVSPYHLQHGHTVEDAPRELRTTPDSTYPKRIATQRVIDRYRAHGFITASEWQAADAVWRYWCDAGLEARLSAGYDPDAIGSGAVSTDGMVARRIDGALWIVNLFEAIPYQCRGVVRAVVIEDRTAADWARGRGFTGRDAKGHGRARLSQGLQALARFWGY